MIIKFNLLVTLFAQTLRYLSIHLEDSLLVGLNQILDSLDAKSFATLLVDGHKLAEALSAVKTTAKSIDPPATYAGKSASP